MFIDPLVFYALWALSSLPAMVCFAFGLVICRGHSRGGLTFCRLGRLGFSFYIRRNA